MRLTLTERSDGFEAPKRLNDLSFEQIGRLRCYKIKYLLEFGAGPDVSIYLTWPPKERNGQSRFSCQSIEYKFPSHLNTGARGACHRALRI